MKHTAPYILLLSLMQLISAQVTYKGYTGCYVVTPNTATDVVIANRSCAFLNGNTAATILSANDNARASDACPTSNCWIGLRNSHPNGESNSFFWLSDASETVIDPSEDYTNWALGQPDVLDETGGYMSSSSDQWFDAETSYQRVVCDKKLVTSYTGDYIAGPGSATDSADAQAKCLAEYGTNLAKIQSAADNAAAVSRCPSVLSDCWIGLTREISTTDGYHWWEDNCNVAWDDYTNWASGEPGSPGLSGVRLSIGGGWVDDDTGTHGYMCDDPGLTDAPTPSPVPSGKGGKGGKRGFALFGGEATDLFGTDAPTFKLLNAALALAVLLMICLACACRKNFRRGEKSKYVVVAHFIDTDAEEEEQALAGIPQGV